MIRELDRMYDAVCRPINVSKDEQIRPIGAFLTDRDPQLPKGTEIKLKLHGPGSNILFTDGHVKNYSVIRMPTYDKLFWDKTTKQWWNASGERKMIAITP
jgi:prepilin-type processing-associated H-X9-DG protein